MKRAVAVLLFFLSVCVLCQNDAYDSSKLFTTQLDNGMTFIYCHNPTTSSSSLFWGFNAGSRYDEKNYEGESKLLERLAFKGTVNV